MKDGTKRKLKILFITAFMALSLAPFVLMPWFGSQEAESADADVTLKPLFVDGKVNKAFFTDAYGKIDTSFMENAGNWFSKKFAFRRELVTAGDMIKAGVFGISGQEGVVAGKNGYLFYRDSFNDFLGRDELSDYQVASLAYNIQLMEEELAAQNIQFLFTVAPNKNSLYPDLMPSRYKPDKVNRNMTRLEPLLKAQGTAYLDLYALFKDIDDVMYLKGDSHWNNMGADLVAGEIISALGRNRNAPDAGRYEIRCDFKGDLYKMLYPAGNKIDEQVYYDKMDPSEYEKRVVVSTIDDTTGELGEIDQEKYSDWSTSSEILTEHLDVSDGRLLMIRDSFGNSLTPWMADEFSEALFLNGTPYDIGRAVDDGYETVVFETVERNLDRLISDAPVLSTTDTGITQDDKDEIELLLAGNSEYDGTLSMEPSDSEFDYTVISGTLDPGKTENDTRFYAVLKNRETRSCEYHALFRTSTEQNSFGCAAYLKTEDLPEDALDLYIAYENSDGWHVSGKAGEYTREES